MKYKFLALLLIPCVVFADSPLEKSKPSTETVAPKEAPPPEEYVLPKPEASPPILSELAYKKQFFRMFFILIFILLSAFITIWLFRRYSPRGALYANHQKNIKILERRHLSPNTYLYHIQVGDKQFIIAESKFQVSTIANLDWVEQS